MHSLNLRKMAVAMSLLYSFSAYSAWYEAEGEALITNGEIHEARQLAIRDALTSIMYQGGASIRALRVIEQGVLEKKSLIVNTNGEIHDMRLLKESIAGSRIKVKVSADISKLEKCISDNYAKTLFIGPISLQKREHGQLGAIYSAPEEISRRLFYRFKEDSFQIDARYLRTRSIGFDNRYDQDIERKMLTVARDISSQYDVQYILFGKVNDMSSYNKSVIGPILLPTTVRLRNYQLKLYVIDGIKGLTVFRKNYDGVTEWPFDVTMKLDVTGNIFWASDYGIMIDKLINEATKDVQEAIYCKASLATIVNVYEDKVIINLGQVNGLKKGDKFKLLQQQFLTEQIDNRVKPIFNSSEVEFTVIDVQSDRAVLATKNESMGNVQIRDILLPVNENYFDKTIYEY